jgi:hypothetical protein
MAVKMLTAMAGDTWAVKPGDRFEADEAYEQRLVDAGLAERIEEEKPAKKKAK